MKIIPKEHKDKMIESYLSGNSAKESAGLFGYSTVTCFNELNRRNIKPHGRINDNRKYNVNQKFFDKIDTEEKAYWLGFITADGYVTKKHLCLDIKDKEHLIKFAHNIQSEHPIRRNRTTHHIRIFSVNLIRSLNKLGIYQAKTFNVKPYMDISDDLIRHYWRGIIDGDGCIYYNKNNKSWRIGLTGNTYIVEAFCHWVQDFVKTKAHPTYYTNYCFIQYGGNKIIKSIAKLLYQNSNVFLDRKKRLAEEIMEDRHVG